jgi:hypothetical protein
MSAISGGGGKPMLYLLVLLIGSIGWTAPAFAQNNCENSISIVAGCSPIIAPEPTPAAPAPQRIIRLSLA